MNAFALVMVVVGVALCVIVFSGKSDNLFAAATGKSHGNSSLK